ncbi:uncharacterized protein A1O9_04933, partial [Exophiala aquamarina CBS 119918]
MGKTKGKNVKLGAFEIQNDLLSDLIAAAGSENSLKAADGHNVDGWADEDIRTYNELLNERAKLEKEKTELEQKSSRHQTQRALLDEHATALDSFFKPQLGGEFKFTGQSSCCLDADADNTCVGDPHGRGFPCKHEVCKRAKSKGVSWVEMDTIKYYHARIMAEKSQRMQKALRKQRDVELVRVKKDDEEEFALRNRKNTNLDKGHRPTLDGSQPCKSDRNAPLDPSTLDMLASNDFLLDPRNSAILEAAKENEHIVRRIRARLDKIRHDVNAGRVSPADARVKLDQANLEMAEAERKNNEFRQMILDAEPALSHLQQPSPGSLSNVLSKTLASSNADAFSQALTVMKGFFSASDPHDVQTAITDLRSVLELNGPMSPVLQKSFQTLEEMLAKPNAKGFTVDVTTADGTTRTCNNVVEVMMNLRLKMQGKDPRSTIADADLNLDNDTMKANHECVEVEEVAKKDMERMVEKMAKDSDDTLMEALMVIKTRAILKSPIPPLSDIVLDTVISDLMFKRAANALILDANKGARLLELSGKLTKLVIETARKKPEKYILTLDLVKEHIVTTPTPPQTLLDALSKVEVQMSRFVAVQEAKKKKNKDESPLAAMLDITSQTLLHPQIASSTRHAITPEEGLHQLDALFDRGGRLANPKTLRDSMALHYRTFLELGPWEMFRIFAGYHIEPAFVFEPWDWEMNFFKANKEILFPPTHQCLEMIFDYQRRGICPGQTALVISQRLTCQIRIDFEAAKTNLKLIKGILSHHNSASNKNWFRTFNFIGQTMIDLFGALVVEISAWEKNDATIMAMDVAAMFCTFSLGASGQMQAYSNLKVLEEFIAAALVDYDKGKNLGRLHDTLGRFYHLCNDPRYLCSFQHKCRAQVQEEDKDKFKATFPVPLEVEEARSKPVEALPRPLKAFEGLKNQMPEPSAPPRHIPIISNVQYEPATDPGAVRSLLNALNSLDYINDLDPQSNKVNDQEIQFRKAIQKYKVKLNEDLDSYHEGRGAEYQKVLGQISSTTNDLKALHKDFVNGTQEKDISTKSRFSEHLDEESTVQENELGSQGISLRHVSRKSPSMVKTWLDITSESGNVQKKMTEASTASQREGRIQSSTAFETNHKRVLPTSTASQSSSTQPGSRATATAAMDTKTTITESTIKTAAKTSAHEPKFSPPEEKIKQQLTTFLNGVLNIGSDVKEMPDSVHKDVFQGVAKHLQDMARGHIDMAWIIAEGRNYTALQGWLRERFGSRPKKEDDDGYDNDDKVAATTA